MDRWEAIVAQARASGVRPWLALKEAMSRCAVEVMAASMGAAVLQGGAALRFAYGSPRLSADVDFVGPEIARVLEERGEAVARAAGELLARPSRWSMTRAGKLVRGKVTVVADRARRLVLPIEAYEVPAHTVRALGDLGAVEEPGEIAADKIVATADRFARRGTLKTTDLFDLWYVRTRLGTPPPSRSLVAAKVGDYGQPTRGADLGAAVRAVPPEELRRVLEGVLPTDALGDVDEGAVLATAAAVLEEYRDVV